MQNNDTIDVMPSTSTSEFEKNTTKDYGQSGKVAIQESQDENESDGQVYIIN